MVPAGNKTKHFSSVNQSAKTIQQFIYGPLFKDILFVANDPPKHNNVIKPCLINFNIILQYVFLSRSEKY